MERAANYALAFGLFRHLTRIFADRRRWSEAPHFLIIMTREINFDRFVRGLVGLLAVAAAAAALYSLRTALIPFVVAWVAAYMLYPVVRFLQVTCRLRSRVLCIVLALALSIGVLGGFFYIVVPPMLEEMVHLKDVALSYIHKGHWDNSTIPPVVMDFIQRAAKEHRIEELLQQKDIIEAVKNTIPRLWGMLWSTAGVIVNAIASLIALLYLFFILTDYERYATGWIKFVPRKRRRIAAQIVSDIERGMSGYFRGQALIALSNCVMFSIGFFLIDFPMPLALGCFIGAISFVPYLQVVGILPATLLALLRAAESGQNFWWLIGGVVLVYLVVQVLQDTIFTPRIMGKIMGLPPAIILLSLSVWGYALGIVGLIIALPVTTLMASYYRRYVVRDTTPFGSLDGEAEETERKAGIYMEASPVPQSAAQPSISDSAECTHPSDGIAEASDSTSETDKKDGE